MDTNTQNIYSFSEIQIQVGDQVTEYEKGEPVGDSEFVVVEGIRYYSQDGLVLIQIDGKKNILYRTENFVGKALE